SVVEREDELGYGGRGHRLDEAGARTDDAGVLRLDADHEAGHVLHEEQRRAVSVHRFAEVRDLLGAVRVDDPTELGGTAVRVAEHSAFVGDHTDGNAFHGGAAADHFRGLGGVELVQLALVEDAAERRPRRGGLTVVYRQDPVGLSLRHAGRGLLAVLEGIRLPWQVGDQLAEAGDAGAVVRYPVVGDTGD